MSGLDGTAVTDKMKYNVKKAAVRSEHHLRNIKASNGTQFDQELGSEIVLELPSNANGSYVDFSKSHLRLTLELTHTSTAGNWTGYTAFQRSPESMIRRLQIFDASGSLLESFEHYNETATVQELLSDTVSRRSTTGLCTSEGLIVDAGNPTYRRDYPDLGGMLSYFGGDTDANNISAYVNGCQRSAALAADTPITTSKDVMLQFSSAMFGGSAEKYLSQTSCNGLRFVLTLDSVANSYMIFSPDVENTTMTLSVKIKDPTYFYSLVTVDPLVDASLLQSGRGPDGLIRVHSQAWIHYSHTVPSDATQDEYVIPIRVSSLKAVYFGFQPSTQSNYGNTLSNFDTTTTLQKFATTTGLAMKASWVDVGMTSYSFYVDGAPYPATPVRVTGDPIGTGTTKPGCAEQSVELQRAMHANIKQDGNVLTLGCGSVDRILGMRTRNMLYGHEFESFSGKGLVIESGLNTLNSNISLRMTFDPTAGNTTLAEAHELRMYACHDVFLLIDPSTGVIRTEI